MNDVGFFASQRSLASSDGTLLDMDDSGAADLKTAFGGWTMAMLSGCYS